MAVQGYIARLDDFAVALGFKPADWNRYPYDDVWVDKNLDVFVKGEKMTTLTVEELAIVKPVAREVSDKPWKVYDARPSKATGGLHITGYNEWTGEDISWDVSSVGDPQYDWSETKFIGGAKAVYDRLKKTGAPWSTARNPEVKKLKAKLLR